MASIAIKKLNFSTGDRHRHEFSAAKLAGYRPPFISNAETEILFKLKSVNYHTLSGISQYLNEEYLAASSKHDVDSIKKICTSPFFRPDDYYTKPICFARVNTAIMKFIGLGRLQRKNILHIAPNWGAYMYYLKNKYGANAFGVDTNRIAIEYAKQGGLDFTLGDASKMSFYPDNYFDAVISRNFLDPSYLTIFFYDQLSQQPASFMGNVIKEVHRILKPGGFFFSQDEDIKDIPDIYSRFRIFYTMKAHDFDEVSILQK